MATLLVAEEVGFWTASKAEVTRVEAGFSTASKVVAEVAAEEVGFSMLSKDEVKAAAVIQEEVEADFSTLLHLVVEAAAAVVAMAEEVDLWRPLLLAVEAVEKTAEAISMYRHYISLVVRSPLATTTSRTSKDFISFVTIERNNTSR